MSLAVLDHQLLVKIETYQKAHYILGTVLAYLRVEEK
jgi:hypothetical protein